MAEPDLLLLAGTLAGRLDQDAASLAAAGSDLGHIVEHPPRAVVHPRSVADIVAVVRFCIAHHLPLATRGSGHTTFGQAQADGGIVLDLSSLEIATRWHETRVYVSAATRWSTLVPEAIARGVTFPVLPDYLGLSVGGTLSSGGVGEASFERGTQTDHLLSLEVVTGTGEHVICSPSDRSELFDACRAGMGQCAIIVAAELQLVPAPARVQLHTLRFPTAAALLNAQRHFATSGFEYLQGSVDPGPNGNPVFTLNAAVSDAVYAPHLPDHAHLGALPGPPQVDLTYGDFTRRIENLEHAMGKIGVWDVPHPWAFLTLPTAHAETFLRAVTAAFQRISDGRILIYLLRPARCHTPLFALPDSEEVFMFGLLNNVTTGSSDATLASNADLAKACLAVGGRVYPVGSVVLTGADWRRQLGPRWDAFQAAKRRFDPAAILTPGVGIFAPPEAGAGATNA